MARTVTAWVARHALPVYFALAFGITWLLAWVGMISRPPVRGLGLVLLHHGPLFGALLVAGITGGKAAVAGLLRSLTAWRAGLRWYLFALSFPFALHLLAVGLDRSMGGALPPFFYAGPGAGLPPGLHPSRLLLPVFLGVLVQAGIAEEPGWRGFALPRLRERYGALASSLILGALWALWHYDPARAPALLHKGLWYPLTVLAMSVLMTWLYDSTEAGLLLCVLLHTASNVSDWVVPTSGYPGAGLRPFAIQVILLCLVALGVSSFRRGVFVLRCRI